MRRLHTKTNGSGILIFEPSWIGDILFTFPFVRTLREAYPAARIACVVVPRYAELFAHNPWIDSVFELSGRAGLRLPIDFLRALTRMSREKYDLCFFLKRSVWRVFLARASGIEHRIGFECVPNPEQGLHQIDRILSLARHWGMEASDSSYEYFISGQDREYAGNLLPSRKGRAKRFVTLNPGANWGGKRWPSEYYSELGHRILRCLADVDLIVTGGTNDVPVAEEIASKLPDARCHNIAGKTSLNQLAAVFEMSALVISADTGPLHLASAVGADTIGLFGPTSPERTGPRGRGRNVVMRRVKSHAFDYRVGRTRQPHGSMRLISPEEVCDVAKGLVASSRESAR